MFAIGDKEWPGVSKAMEEMGELLQVFGKLMGTRGSTSHWSGDLLKMMLDEMADVMASVYFTIDYNGLNLDYIMKRMFKKYAQYEQWHRGENEPIPTPIANPLKDA